MFVYVSVHMFNTDQRYILKSTATNSYISGKNEKHHCRQCYKELRIKLWAPFIVFWLFLRTPKGWIIVQNNVHDVVIGCQLTSCFWIQSCVYPWRTFASNISFNVLFAIGLHLWWPKVSLGSISLMPHDVHEHVSTKGRLSLIKLLPKMLMIQGYHSIEARFRKSQPESKSPDTIY